MSASKHPLPSEIEVIFKKIYRLLENDTDQNNTLPEPYRSQIANGLDCDELPNASGEFGHTTSNPIPTNGALGEVLYLSRLRTKAASPIMFHRVRAEDGAAGPVDVYEVLSLDRKVCELLFLSMYHPRKSRKVPRGYSYAAKVDPSNFTFGVNHIVANFPEKLDAHIRKWQMEVLGIPLPVSRVREAINGSRFNPSALSDDESLDLGSPKRQLRDDFLKLVQAAKDPRFQGQNIAIGLDGIVRPFADSVDKLTAAPAANDQSDPRLVEDIFTWLLEYVEEAGANGEITRPFYGVRHDLIFLIDFQDIAFKPEADWGSHFSKRDFIIWLCEREKLIAYGYATHVPDYPSPYAIFSVL